MDFAIFFSIASNPRASGYKLSPFLRLSPHKNILSCQSAGAYSIHPHSLPNHIIKMSRSDTIETIFFADAVLFDMVRPLPPYFTLVPY